MIVRMFATTEFATLPILTAHQGGSFAFYGYKSYKLPQRTTSVVFWGKL